MSIRMEVWGDLACFTRPEMKIERVSYEVPTPSAARGMLEAVYYHPGLRYTIDKIYVINPISFTNIRRNEVKSIISHKRIEAAYHGKEKRLYLDTTQDIQQRATMALQKVHYVFEAHFDMTEKANPTDNSGKFQDILKRRLRKGQCFMQPYLGCREMSANFALWEGGSISSIPVTKDLGFMLYDLDYSHLKNITPMFFHAQMVNGVINLRDCEVHR